MDSKIDPSCHLVKPILAGDALCRLAHTLAMDKKALSTFQRGVRTRIKLVREAMGWTQQEAADALGIALHTYRKYEIRSVMPPHHMVRFASATGYSLDYLLIGKPLQIPHQQTPAQFRRRA